MSTFLESLSDYVRNVQASIGATAAAVCVMQRDRIVGEWYSGSHDSDPASRPVDARTEFNVGSIRKTYLGLAISMLIEDGAIRSLDDEIGSYLSEFADAARGTTLRHLLTHTHGLVEENGRIRREFPAGQSWAYRNTGINLLIELVKRLSELSLSDYMRKRVFEPYELQETGWRTERREELIYNYYRHPDSWVGPNDSDAGDQSNLFVSARDLAKWGSIHLQKGAVNGNQLLPRSVFDRVIALQTPDTVPPHLPRNGFIWWLQHDTPLNQLGEQLPPGSYQVLGITGCACLVIPEYDAVAVRMYNQLGNPAGYDYLQDIREFGNRVNEALRQLA